MDPLAFDALYLPGGHGCLFDVNRNPLLHSAVKTMYDHGGLLAAVCHATSTFAFVKKAGRSIIEGHAITGFPHALDSILIKAGLVRPEFLPLPLINDDELKNAGAQHSTVDETLAFINPRHWTASLPFITGMGPKSAAPVAKALIKALKERTNSAEPDSHASASQRA
jgi:putative intracellular protease/amidase